MNENEPVYSQHRGSGVTPAERYLKQLCDHTFLSLWSHAGIYRDQGRVGGRGDGKELCDLLVVFENQVIIFSDKDCAFPNTGDIKVDWARWFRRAVWNSARQIFGAERWIVEHPDRIYLDRACTIRFPVELPKLDQAVFHRVVVAHDASLRCRRTVGGSGSFLIMPEIVGRAAHESSSLPFAIGQIEPSKGYVHVLDDTALDIVLKTRDTIADFVDYLRKKESLILSGRLMVAPGEEDLLGYFLGQLNERNEHDFVIPRGVDALVIDEGHWTEFSQSRQRAAQVEADSVSYAWDKLIETFAHHFLTGTSYFSSDSDYASHETPLRHLAKVPRLTRRMLAQAILTAIDRGRATDRFVRVVPPWSSGDPYFAFVTLKQPNGMSFEKYRKGRRWLLQIVCQVVKLEFPDARDIVGIATEPGLDNGGRSEDAIYFDAREWTDDLASETRDLQEKLGLLQKATKIKQSFDEYPGFGKRSRISRNERCPCGSGKKYKHCCLQRSPSTRRN
jgi:hypothetical protein